LQHRGTSTYTPQAANGNIGESFVRRTYSPNNDSKSTSYGWFNSATWHITDKLNLTGGARVAWDKKEIESQRLQGTPTSGGLQLPDFVPVPGTSSTTVSAQHSWRAFDWRGTVDYHFTPDIMAYATASKAYKAGAYPAFTFISCTTPLTPGSSTCPTGAQQSTLYAPIPPEKVTNLEGGLRTTFFNNRLRINPTGYYMAWTDRQTAVRRACVVSADCPTGSNVFLASTGNLDLYGVELDAQFALTDSLTLDGAFGTTKSIIHDVTANGGPNLFPPQASPTANLGATYTLRDTQIGGITFNVNWSYTARQQTYPESTDPALRSDGSYELAGYTVLNSRLQWSSSDRSNVITLFANNLLDRDYATFGTKFGGGFWDTFNPGIGLVPAPPGDALRNMVSVTRARPREIGITLQHNFN
jgi:iron complex outermembrane receptor protein